MALFGEDPDLVRSLGNERAENHKSKTKGIISKYSIK